jgi:hypothetical protein
VSYMELGPALVIAGIGTSFCFPTVANSIMGSVPLKEAGVAAGTNSTIRELGGVLGVAVLASVFARHGVYTSHETFVAGFTQALWVAVGFSGVGVVAALMTRGRKRDVEVARLAPEIAVAGQSA